MHQPTHPQTNRQTGPITIHCVAASVRVFKYLADKLALTVPGTSLKWTAQCHYQYTPVYTYLPTPIAAVYYLSLTITLSGPHLHNDWLPVLKQKQLSHIVHSSGCKRDRKAPPPRKPANLFGGVSPIYGIVLRMLQSDHFYVITKMRMGKFTGSTIPQVVGHTG